MIRLGTADGLLVGPVPEGLAAGMEELERSGISGDAELKVFQ